MRIERRLLDQEKPTLGDWWPPPQRPGAQLGGVAQRAGRLEGERARAVVRGLSSFDPSGEGRWELGRQLTRRYSHAFDDSLGKVNPKHTNFCSQRTPVSHKVIEKRRRDRINRCLNELGKTVPMALAKQVKSVARIVCQALRTLRCHSWRDAGSLGMERALHVGLPPRGPER